MTERDPATAVRAATALDHATRLLVSLQYPDGYWKGEFETSVIADASDIILRCYLSIAEPRALTAAADTILRDQADDGGWRTYYGGPPDLMLSVLCYVALRLAGHPAEDARLRRAAECIRSLGGVEKADNPAILAWLALLGLWPWRDIPLIPPEIVLLPTWFPGNIYQIGAAARGITVANSLFMSECPVRPAGFDLRELYADPAAAGRLPRGLAYRAVTAVTHWYRRHHLGFLRRRAIAKAERWLIRRQERDGGWGGNWLQTADTLVALETVGYARDHPVIAAALRALDAYVIEDERGRRVEMWTAVVMDTALAVSALSATGRPDVQQAADRGAAWLLDHQVTRLGDWAELTRDPVAGAWPYEFVNDANPDADDTSYAVCALRHRNPQPSPEVAAACDRAVQWLLSQQGRDGGWAAFEPYRWKLPGGWKLARMGFLEPHSADIAGHVLEALGAHGMAEHPQCQRGIRWLRDHQRPDGSWPGWWGCYHVYGTGAAISGLVACGVPGTDPTVARACAWLERHQQPDGGWGEDIRAVHDPGRIGTGASTPSQTSWAVLALVAAGRANSTAVAKGIEFLVRTQRPDGDWDEPWHTWLVVHDHFYWRDTLLRLVYPVAALSAYLNATASAVPEGITARGR